MSADFYSARVARRSLVHFVLGRVASAVLGLAVLLFTLRLVPVEDFGAYVALIAATNIIHVASGLGLSFFAQRYVPELRIRASASQFNRQLWWLLAARAMLSGTFALLAWLTVSWWSGWLGLRLTTSVAAVFALNLFLVSIMRYNDELMNTLLMQGWVQIQAIGRNLVRLAALGLGLRQAGDVGLHFLLVMEVVVGASAFAAGVIVFRAYTKRASPNRPDVPVRHDLPDAWRQSIRFYWAQLLGLGYGANAIKLVVTAVVGVHGTAVLGFATSIADLLRNYSPAFLLGNWVRPIMVSRFVENPTVSALKPLTRLIINLSVVGLLPFALVFVVFGDEVVKLLAAGKYPEAAPLLAPFVGVVCLQAVHTVLAMVCSTTERAAFLLLATTIAAVTLPLAYVLTQFWGLTGTVAALCLGELLWLATVYIRLASHFGKADFADSRGIVRAVLFAVALGAPLALLHQHYPLSGAPTWLTAAAVASILYWVIVWHSTVIASDQRALIANFLKRAAKSS